MSGDEKDFVKFLGKTSQVAPRLKTQLRKEIKTAGEELANKVRAEVKRPPLQPHRGDRAPKSRGLRAKIASGVEVRLATTGNNVGAIVKATTKALPADQKKLVKKYNSARGWRHPIFDRKITKAKNNQAAFRALGAPGFASGMVEHARNSQKWAQQKGRPYFGTVIEKNHQIVTDAIHHAVDEAKKSLSL
jgi:hypothetical protein